MTMNHDDDPDHDDDDPDHDDDDDPDHDDNDPDYDDDDDYDDDGMRMMNCPVCHFLHYNAVANIWRWSKVLITFAFTQARCDWGGDREPEWRFDTLEQRNNISFGQPSMTMVFVRKTLFPIIMEVENG